MVRCGSHSRSSALIGAHVGFFANSASMVSCVLRGSCFRLICSACQSLSLRHRSLFFSSRRSCSSTTANTISMCFRIWRILSKLPASFSRRRLVCGRLVFSLCRKQLNGLASFGAGGGWSRRKHGLPVASRFSHQYSYTASMIAGLPDMSFSSSSASPLGSAPVPAIARHLSWYEMIWPFSVAFAATISIASSFASPHRTSSFQIMCSNFSPGSRFWPSLYFTSQSSSSLSRSYSTTSSGGAPNVLLRRYVCDFA
mmetsp:Transcript_13538/g.44750  ORF Transcript_13538/g.44750 Transcript_13538/m.44750 type:complete len:255 (-) Transcript_13538:681-1445(-)